ncbi:MAG TPA: tetratricopeptide repeat protein [Chthoniobacterales bacterium]|jgi:tetratricopeptide (TPR) repeat protein|nr:tetratricopeptide repeat protein [Chthoniobacterales bacterium]
MKNSRWPLFGICVFLVALIWAVFGQTFRHQFIDYDDPLYVLDNAHVRAGLTWRGIAWAFTHVHSQNWHPLTTMSHMLDCQLFGVNPGAHHLVNVFWHSVTALLLFMLLQQMTSRVWASAFVAAVFAIHPLRVESVAWISERKDLLSGFFFMLTLFAYASYARRPSGWRYGAVSIVFACGLMSKPMLVTLPLVLLLLDYWPLNRFQKTEDRRRSAGKLVLEKVPLLVLSIGSAIATLIAQRGDIVQIAHLPLSRRAANALAAYLIYLWQMIWPVNLATIYPYPGELPVWRTASAGVPLILITVGVLVLRKRQPYLVTGWFSYLIMLLPVIGLIQVGGQAHADRYTYLSQIGLYVAITWAIVDLARSLRYRREVLAATASFAVMALAWRAWIQTSYWRDTERLWNRTFVVTGRNDIAHFQLGEFFLKRHRLDEAIAQFRIRLTSHPLDPDANFEIGSAYMEKGEFDISAQHFERTLKAQPGNPEAETNLANALLNSGRLEEAVEHYRHVVPLKPSSALAHYNLAVGLHRLGQLPEAIAHYKEALALDPNYPDAEYFLGQALLQNGQPDEAKIHLEKH